MMKATRREGGIPPKGHPRDASSDRIAAARVYDSQVSTRWFMQHVRELVGSADLRGPRDGHAAYELPSDPRALDQLAVRGPGLRATSLRNVLHATDTDGCLVLRGGTVVYEKYFNGLRADAPHLWHSVSKSLVSCVAGNLVGAGRLDTSRPVAQYVAELSGSAYGDARVQHLLDMQVGIDYSEDYADVDSDVNELDRIYGLRPPRGPNHPGSTYAYATTKPKKGAHGREFDYVSLNTNVLAWVIERATGEWLPDLIRSEVWGKIGGEHDAYVALDVAGGVQAESGMCSSLRDLARLGLALLHGGRLADRQVVPAAWVDEIVRGGDPEAFARHDHDSVLPEGSYKNNFWVARSGADAAFMGLGIYGQMVYVNPAADLVVAKFSSQAVADSAECFRREFLMCECLAEQL